MVSLDTMTFSATQSGGTCVTYDATLTLNGPRSALDPLLGLAFGRIGDRAAAGLRAALSAA